MIWIIWILSQYNAELMKTHDYLQWNAPFTLASLWARLVWEYYPPNKERGHRHTDIVSTVTESLLVDQRILMGPSHSARVILERFCVFWTKLSRVWDPLSRALPSHKGWLIFFTRNIQSYRCISESDRSKFYVGSDVSRIWRDQNLKKKFREN